MKPAAPVTRIRTGSSYVVALLALLAGLVDLLAVPLDLFRALEVLESLVTASQPDEGAAEVVLGIRLVPLSASGEYRQGLPGGPLRTRVVALPEETRGLVGQCDAIRRGGRRRGLRGRGRRFGHRGADGRARERPRDDTRRGALPASAGREDGREAGACDGRGEEERSDKSQGRRVPRRRARGSKTTCLSGAGGERLPQYGDEVGSRLKPLCWVLGERALEDGVELRGQIGLRGDGRDRRLHVGGRLRRRAVGLEGPPAGEQLEGDDRECITVAGRAGALALGLLGREVPGGSHHRPGHREGLHAGSAGDPEVGDTQRALSVEQEVARLHVPVDDSVAVGCVKSRRRLLEPRQYVAGGR